MAPSQGSSSGVANAPKTETVFSCYYKPVDEPITPPESPYNEARGPLLG